MATSKAATSVLASCKPLRYVTWKEAVLACLFVVLALSTQWYTLNISSSVPLGLYRYAATSVPLHYGMLVHVPAVPYGRAWYYSWLPLLKPIAGLPGDEVCVWPEGVMVRGEGYGAVHTAHRGKPLPVFWGCHVVGDGEVFVASHEANSLDGRYFGVTTVAKAVVAVPVWTWR